mgnify:CR=1 FL=1
MRRPTLEELVESVKKPVLTSWSRPPKVPVHRQEDYLRLLRKNYEDYGLEFDESKFRVDCDPPEIQKFEEPEAISHPFGQLYLNLTYTKTKVKVKINCALYDIHEKYYAVGKTPPVKALVQALKTVGYSDDFLKKVIKSHDAKVRDGKILAKHIQKVFKMQEKKKKVTKKAVAVEEEAEASPSDDEEDDDEGERENDVDDEEGFDMETADDDEDVVDDAVLSDVEL